MKILTRIATYVISETRTWGGLITFVVSFFILVTAITNALYGIFDFKLLPVFENTLAHVRQFIHELFELLLYRPVGWMVSSISSLVFPEIVLPDLRPPKWYTDIVLVSMILSRAERAAMKMSPPVAHTPDDEGTYSRLEIGSWYLVLLLYVPSKKLLTPVQKWAPKSVAETARIFLDGITWLGFWFLLHDIMVVRSNWQSDCERDASHRAFVAYLVLSMVAAFLAVAIFFIMNGYLHDQFLNEMPTG